MTMSTFTYLCRENGDQSHVRLIWHKHPAMINLCVFNLCLGAAQSKHWLKSAYFMFFAYFSKIGDWVISSKPDNRINKNLLPLNRNSHLYKVCDIEFIIVTF